MPKINQKPMRFESIKGNDLIVAAKSDFEAVAIQIYHYQYQYNLVYKAYNDLLKVNPQNVRNILDIPFMPISFFKTHKIATKNTDAFQQVFESSGTTDIKPSKHYVADVDIYNHIAMDGFRQFYHSANNWVILALLPSYLERQTSSLVHMVANLMNNGGNEDNGFFLNDLDQLALTIKRLKKAGKKILLIGVTFALLDFAEQFPIDLKGVVILETGGMKGRKIEWTRNQVHDFLKSKFNVDEIHSEYGMTELLSQAYSQANGVFRPIDTMRVYSRDISDPLETNRHGTGVLNVVDIANVNSCSFIATEDLGKVNPDGSFEVLGRMDFSSLRGCSLMAI
jgi:hypothetical protein